jgi:hypothetical protein
MTKRKDPALKKKVGRPRKYTDLDLFQKKIDAYFEECDEKKEPYLIYGLVMHLGMSREHILKYEDERPGFSEAIKRARERVQRQIEQMMVERGTGNVAGLIFWLKNNAGWRDIMGLEHTGADGAPLEMSSLEVAARIATILELARKKKEELTIETEETKAIPEKIPLV